MSNLHLDGSKLFWHLDRVRAWLAGEEISPIHVEISPTSQCNYRCIFCYADYSGHRKSKLDSACFLQLMRDLGEMKVRSCLLAGDGEPLLHPDAGKAIVVGKESGVDMALNTNGRLLHEEVSEQVLPHLTWLRFSVMSLQPKTYSLLHGVKPENMKITLKNIEKAVEIKRRAGYEVTIGLQQVLLPENGAEVADLAAWSRDAGLDYYVLKPFSLHYQNRHYKEGVSAVKLRNEFMDTLRTAESMNTDTFTSIVRWNTFSDDGAKEYQRCLGLPFILQVGADSHAYTCCPFFGQEEFSYGDLKEKRLPEIWFSEKAINLRKKIAKDFDLTNCMTYCRHHQINKQLWALAHPPQHVNFI